MNEDDIKNWVDIYLLFLQFFIFPKKIKTFSEKPKLEFVREILIFFIMNSVLFVLLFSWLDTKGLEIRWIPLVVFISCFIYVLVCIPISLSKDIRIAITEAFVVLSTLLYLNITIYLLFLFFEIYIFYYLSLAFCLIITIRICRCYPIKITNKKRLFLGFLTLVSSLLTNYLSLIAINNFITNSKPVMADAIYQESIEKTGKVIEFSKYCVEHQLVIIELQSKYLESGNADTLRLLNNQFDLVIAKKDEISKYKEEIIFNRNKQELLLLLDTLWLYENLKWEINAYEYIPREYYEKNKEYSNEIITLDNIFSQDDVSELDILSASTKIIEMELFFNDTTSKVIISKKSAEEITSLIENISRNVEKLEKQIKKTENYWNRQQKFSI